MRSRRVAARAGVLALALCLSACGGDSAYAFLDTGADDVAAAWAALPYESIEFGKSSRYIGWGDGPGSYRAAFHRGGSCTARGILPSGAKGDFRGEVQLFDYARLCRLIEQAGLPRVASYDREVFHGDDLSLRITGHGGEMLHRIDEYALSGPSELWVINQCIDAIATRIRWDPVVAASERGK